MSITITIPRVVPPTELDIVMKRVTAGQLYGKFTLLEVGEVYRCLYNPLLGSRNDLFLQIGYIPVGTKKTMLDVKDPSHYFMGFVQEKVLRELAAVYHSHVTNYCDTPITPLDCSSFSSYLEQIFEIDMKRLADRHKRQFVKDESYRCEYKAFQDLAIMGLEDATDDFKRAFGIDWV